MKPSHTQTPRSLSECQFTPGYKRYDYDEAGAGWAAAAVNLGVSLAIVLAVAAAIVQWAEALPV